MNTKQPGPCGSDSSAELGPLPEPAGFRTRYRSEPGMVGHYPWTYAGHRRRGHDRPECEYEDLYTADQVRAAVAAAIERCAKHIDVPYERRGDEFAEALRNMDVPIERALSVDGA